MKSPLRAKQVVEHKVKLIIILVLDIYGKAGKEESYSNDVKTIKISLQKILLSFLRDKCSLTCSFNSRKNVFFEIFYT